jgi:peroxiredoxin
VVVWGIGSQDDLDNLAVFTEQMGITFPVLYDEDGAVHDQYNPGNVPTNSIYPQDWVIGADGTVKYVNTVYDPDEIMAVLDAELSR